MRLGADKPTTSDWANQWRRVISSMGDIISRLKFSARINVAAHFTFYPVSPPEGSAEILRRSHGIASRFGVTQKELSDTNTDDNQPHRCVSECDHAMHITVL